MIDVDRQANGLLIAQAQRPGVAHQPSERFQPVPGPHADAEARGWLKTVVEGVRTQLHGGMTLAVVVTPETGWEEDQLDDVAVAGEALIILHRPDAKQEWKPRLLEPKAVPVKDAPAVPEPKVVRYQENMGPIQATPDAVWISRVPRAVVGLPDRDPGTAGRAGSVRLRDGPRALRGGQAHGLDRVAGRCRGADAARGRAGLLGAAGQLRGAPERVARGVAPAKAAATCGASF